jgi:hypothetical protein
MQWAVQARDRGLKWGYRKVVLPYGDSRFRKRAARVPPNGLEVNVDFRNVSANDGRVSTRWLHITIYAPLIERDDFTVNHRLIRY